MAKHDSILRNKNYSKNKITLAKLKPKYLVNFSFPGQQDFLRRYGTTLPNSLIVRRRTFSPLQHSSLTRAKIWCQHIPPNFGVKCPFYFEINLCQDYVAELSFHLLQSRFPCWWRTKISSLPLTPHLLIRTTGICRFIFHLFTHMPLDQTQE